MFRKIFKTIFILSLCFGTLLNTHAAVIVSDGSAFITKSEFKALVNEASGRIEALELHADSQIDTLVNSFLGRNNIWHPQKQKLNSNTTMDLAPCNITLSSNAATGNATIQSNRVCIDEIQKSGMMVISLFYRAKDTSAAGKTFRWGYMGTMTNNGNWQTDNGIELKVIFYEATKKEDGTYNLDERKYVCLIGATQGAKREASTSTYGHSTAIGLSPIEVLVPAYFFVTKKSRISWAAIESYKFALTSTCVKVCEGTNDGQNVYVRIQDPVVY